MLQALTKCNGVQLTQRPAKPDRTIIVRHALPEFPAARTVLVGALLVNCAAAQFALRPGGAGSKARPCRALHSEIPLRGIEGPTSRRQAVPHFSRSQPRDEMKGPAPRPVSLRPVSLATRLPGSYAAS